MSGQSLARWLRGRMEADGGRRAPEVWWVQLQSPQMAGRLECRDDSQLRAVIASLWAAGMRYRVGPGRSVTIDPPRDVLVASADDMPALVACLRDNGCAGRYRKAGTERWYPFRPGQRVGAGGVPES